MKRTAMLSLICTLLISSFGVQFEAEELNYAPVHPTSEQVETAASTDLVVFEDSMFEQVIANELSVPIGEITVGDMETITSVYGAAQGITDITGIEYAVNLNSIDLISNEITDVSPLSGLTNLSNLDIYSNQITDVTPLSGLTNLTNLSLGDNQIVDVSPLSGLTNLTNLSLEHNQIVDVSPLSGLKDLTNLVLYDNEISDVSALSSLINLTDLNINTNQITDVSALSSLTNLTLLNALENEIADISALSNLTNLKYLDLNDNEIADISALSNLTNLEYLGLRGNQVADISALSTLTNLDYLVLRDNQIVDISALSNLTNLSYLGLGNNQIVDVSPLSGLTNLGILTLFDNHITDISPLILIADEDINLSNQTVRASDINVSNNNELYYTITDINGVENQVSLGIPELGTYEMSGTWLLPQKPDAGSKAFSGTVSQTVTYELATLNGIDTASINEGSVLSDKDLITLFEVVNSGGEMITVDQSAVDYSTPATYQITFTDEAKNTKKSNLVVKDVKPTLSIDKNSISIKVNSNIDDVTNQLNIVASELSKGDINSKVILDDSEINYKKVGSYKLKVSVSDDEDNTVVKYVTVSIVDDKEDINLIVEENDESGRIDFYQYDSQGNPLSGFEYGIYDEDGNLVDTVITDENGHAVSDELADGKYYVKLISVPDGYELDDNVYEMTVGSEVSSSVNYATVDESNEGKRIDDGTGKQMVNMSMGKPSSQMNSAIENSLKQNSDVNNEIQSPDLKETSLSFFVYNQYKKGIEGIEYTLFGEDLIAIGTFTSSASGQVNLGSLKVGQYYLVQTSTIDGYVLNDEVISFTITDNGKVIDLPNEIFLEAINEKGIWEMISIGKLLILILVLIILMYIVKKRK